jgi:hypothetical protein
MRAGRGSNGLSQRNAVSNVITAFVRRQVVTGSVSACPPGPCPEWDLHESWHETDIRTDGLTASSNRRHTNPGLARLLLLLLLMLLLLVLPPSAASAVAGALVVTEPETMESETKATVRPKVQ